MNQLPAEPLHRANEASPAPVQLPERRIATVFWSLVVLTATLVSLQILRSDVFAPRQGLQIAFVVEDPGPATVFWSPDQRWTTANSITIPARPGTNQIFFPVPSRNGSIVRLDPGERIGSYEILEVLRVQGEDVVDLGPGSLATPTQREGIQRLDGRTLSTSDTDPQILIELGEPFDRGLPALAAGALMLLVVAGSGVVAYLWRVGRVTEQGLAVGFVVWLYGVFLLYLWRTAPRFPYWDDWRYLRDVTESGRLPVSPSWLFEASNDTVWVTGRLLDASILNATNFNFFALQMFGALLLGVFLVLAVMLVRRVASRVAPGATPYATLLIGFALMAQSYWIQPAIAYHQFLPLLCAVGILLLLAGESHVWWRTLAAALLATAAGLAYISGAVMLVVLGAAYMAVWWRDLRSSREWRRHAPAISVLAIGLATSLVQLLLVMRAQGSLLDGTSASETVFPWDPAFWAFYLGVAGRSVGLQAAPLPVLLAIAGVIAVAPVVVWFALSDRRATSHPVGRYERFVLVFGAALVPIYFALVSAGRAGLAPSQSFRVVLDYGGARFHFFWGSALLALVWLGWYTAMSSAAPAYKRSALVALVVVTGLIAVPKSPSPWIYSNEFEPRRIAFLRTEGCIASHVRDGDLGTVRCQHASSGDIGPALRIAYRFDMAFIDQGRLSGVRPTTD